MLLVTVSILLLIFSRSCGDKNRTLNKIYIPKDIHDIRKQIKVEYHVNPQSKREFKNLLERSEPFKPYFGENLINENSKRFDNIIKVYEMKKNKTILGGRIEKNALRQGRQKITTKKPTLNSKALERAFALMKQFLYAARYKLQYGQVLRNAYKNLTEYKIGYCFALMRDIRMQQMMLYTTMHYNYNTYSLYSYADFQSYFELYDKIVRLDVNMLDEVSQVQILIQFRLTSTTAKSNPIVTTTSHNTTTAKFNPNVTTTAHNNTAGKNNSSSSGKGK